MIFREKQSKPRMIGCRRGYPVQKRMRWTEAVRAKILGGQQQAQRVAEKRTEILELVGSQPFQEITVK
jgi:hypothetical protein